MVMMTMITQDTIDSLYRVEMLSSMGLGFLLLARRLMPVWASRVSPCDLIWMNHAGHCPSLLNLATGVLAVFMVCSAVLLCIASVYRLISMLFFSSGVHATVEHDEKDGEDNAQPPLFHAPPVIHRRRRVAITRVNCH